MEQDPGLQAFGRILLFSGLAVAAAGGLLLLAGRLPWLGRLPGDLVFRTGRVTILVPIATCVILSILLTIVLNLLFRR